MAFVPLREMLPELALKEMRTLTVEGGAVPPDTYALVELYCNDPGCDCRRVFIQVHGLAQRDGPLANINYGWEDEDFYRRWFPGPLDDAVLADLKGPALARGNPQSVYADDLLRLVKLALQDEAYVQRLARHYALFRAGIDQGQADRGRAVAKKRARKSARKRQQAARKKQRKKKR